MYTYYRDAGIPTEAPELQTVEKLEGDYILEITPTFSTEKDPFALQSDDQSSSSLELRLNGMKLEVPADEMIRGKVIEIRNLPNLQVGFNEIYTQASPPIAENMMDHGIRVKLSNKGFVIVDNTVWGSRGALVSGTISFELSQTKDADHDH